MGRSRIDQAIAAVAVIFLYCISHLVGCGFVVAVYRALPRLHVVEEQRRFVEDAALVQHLLRSLHVLQRHAQLVVGVVVLLLLGVVFRWRRGGRCAPLASTCTAYAGTESGGRSNDYRVSLLPKFLASRAQIPFQPVPEMKILPSL
jgi:hypothetical protein